MPEIESSIHERVVGGGLKSTIAAVLSVSKDTANLIHSVRITRT